MSQFHPTGNSAGGRVRRLWPTGLLVGLLIASLANVPSAAAADLTVAAAADLRFALPELAERYERQSGNHVRLTFGASGNLYSQIENGAPFDLFFSADTEYPQKLVASGRAQGLTIYGIGELALWTRQAHLKLRARGLDVLASPDVSKIAIANPVHAPYGRAAEAALRSAAIYDGIKSKLVYGENVAQTAQFAQSGNADVAIISLSQAKALEKEGDYWVVPRSLYPRLLQAAVVIRASANSAAAEGFLHFVTSSAGREILERHGFQMESAGQRAVPATGSAPR